MQINRLHVKEVILFSINSVVSSVFFMNASPNQVQEGICWADLCDFLLLGELIFGAFARVDDENHDDADEDGDEGGSHVVDHRPHAHLP